MKKILIISTLFIAIVSCNSSSTSNSTDADTTDKTGLTNPSAIDTTEHPNGITTGDVISTDTGAMNVQKSINKAKASKHK